MAAHAVLVPTLHLVIIGVIIVNIKGTLVGAHLTLDAPLRVSFHQKLRW
jgi:hypothetical protein